MIELHEIKHLKSKLDKLLDNEGKYLDITIGTLNIEVIYSHIALREYSMYVTDRRTPDTTNAYHFGEADTRIEKFGKLLKDYDRTHRLVIEFKTNFGYPVNRTIPSGRLVINAVGMDMGEYPEAGE